MPPSPARIAAFDILLNVERQGAYASELLHSTQFAKLSRQDHGLATEIVMGVLRWRSVLDGMIAQHSSQGIGKLDLEVLNALRIGAYQIGFLAGVPSRAAVNESVELVKRARKRSAAPYVNAVLRNMAGSGLPAVGSASTPAEIAQVWAHPIWLVERWAREFGIETACRICESDQEIPQAALYLADAAVERELKEEGIELGPGELVASARRVKSGNVAVSRAFREGRVFIQDEASQLVAMLVGNGASILDCCAAPGGKTRLMARRNAEASVVAVELHPHRARLLRKLVPDSNVEVVAGDVREVLPDRQFERVLADVPCSGTGTLSHNPEIKWRLRAEDLQDLQARQVEILTSAMRRVVEGGKLVYSTCSLEREENVEVVERALADSRSFRVVPCRELLEGLHLSGELAWAELDSLVSGPFLRTIPGVHPSEGFLAVLLERI